MAVAAVWHRARFGLQRKCYVAIITEITTIHCCNWLCVYSLIVMEWKLAIGMPVLLPSFTCRTKEVCVNGLKETLGHTQFVIQGTITSISIGIGQQENLSVSW